MSNTITKNSSFLSKLCLFIIAIYLILGNLPRIIHMGHFSNNIAITEILIYVVLISYAFIHLHLHINLMKVWGMLLIILLSFFYGANLNGFTSSPLLYSVRLILMFLSANIAGILLFKVYKYDLLKVFNFMLKIYFGVVVLGFILYIMFPNSVDLWAFLANYGIIFNGDPHQRRFISTYLDPNFYGAIALIPIMLSGFMFKETKKKRYLLLLLIFLVTLYFTYSRSGMGASVLLLFVIVFRALIKNRFFIQRGIKVKNFLIMWFGIPIIAFICYLNSDMFARLVKRFSGITHDHSALARLGTFNIGLDIFKSHLLMGIGYDYLDLNMEKLVHLSSVDSSLLSIFTNFGLIFTLIMFAMFMHFIINSRIRIKSQFNADTKYLRFYDMLLIYTFISIIFTSEFNNLLFYQFWFFPVAMLFNYFSYLTYKSKKQSDTVEDESKDDKRLVS